MSTLARYCIVSSLAYDARVIWDQGRRLQFAKHHFNHIKPPSRPRAARSEALAPTQKLVLRWEFGRLPELERMAPLQLLVQQPQLRLWHNTAPLQRAVVRTDLPLGRLFACFLRLCWGQPTKQSTLSRNLTSVGGHPARQPAETVKPDPLIRKSTSGDSGDPYTRMEWQSM